MWVTVVFSVLKFGPIVALKRYSYAGTPKFAYLMASLLSLLSLLLLLVLLLQMSEVAKKAVRA